MDVGMDVGCPYRESSMARKPKKTEDNPPQRRPRFTQAALKGWNRPGTYCDDEGGGLYLQVIQVRRKGEPQWITNSVGERVPKVRKYWTYRYWRTTRDGGRKLHEYGIGSFKDYSLKEARDIAQEQRKVRDEFRDPIQVRRKRKQGVQELIDSLKTFEEAATACWQSLHPQWGTRHANDWLNSLKIHVFPSIGSFDLRSLTKQHVEEILRPIWTAKAETATRVRQRIEAVIDFAKGKGWFTGDNPATWKGNLKALLMESPRLKLLEHHPSLPFPQMGLFMAALRTQPGIAAIALEFTILTATRSLETRLATGKEFDLERGLWTIPAKRMKAKKEHLVPLSDRACEILRSIGKLTPDGYIFPGGKPNAPLSDGAMLALLKRMDANRVESEGIGWRDPEGDRIVTHGFRASFRTWAGEETDHPRDAIEFALAHQLPDKVEAAYARATLLDKRRPLMADWAAWCEPRSHLQASLEAAKPHMQRVKVYDGEESKIVWVERT